MMCGIVWYIDSIEYDMYEYVEISMQKKATADRKWEVEAVNVVNCEGTIRMYECIIGIIILGRARMT